MSNIVVSADHSSESAFFKDPLNCRKINRAVLHEMMSLRLYIPYLVGLWLAVILLGQIVGFFVPIDSSLPPSEVPSAIVRLVVLGDVCVIPLAGLWSPVCAHLRQQERELRRRAGFVQSTETVAKLTSGILDVITSTPQPSEIQRVSHGAYWLSQVFKAQRTLPAADDISRDLEKIGHQTKKVLDNMLQVEAEGRLVVADMMAGCQELVEMLTHPTKYSAFLVEKQVNNFVARTDAMIGSLQSQLNSAQKRTSGVLTLQNQLHGKLLTEQIALQQTQDADRETRTFTATVLQMFDSNLPKPINDLESSRLKKHLDLMEQAIAEVKQWSDRLSTLSLFHRYQITTRKQQLGRHQRLPSERSVEDRIKAIDQLLEPARQRLARLEQGIKK
ncbi:hypothetical protein CF319_g5341 [Tilletia indica]|nr:hypothetical protein CF319_g5341 [Tilletia indica]